MSEFGTNTHILAVKKETVPGTFEALTAPDFNIKFYEKTPLEFTNNFNRQGKPADGTLNQAQSKSSFTTGSMTGHTLLDYTGNEETEPAQGPLFEAAGFVKSGGTGSPIRYTWTGISPCSSVSLISSVLTCGSTPSSIDKKGRGVVPDLTIEGPDVGQEIKCNWTFSSAWAGQADNAAPIKALTGEDAGPSEKMYDPAFTFAGTLFKLHKWSIAMGLTNTVVKDPDDFSNKRGVLKYKVTGADPKLMVTVQKVPLATQDNTALAQADTVFNPITISGQHWDFVITDANLLDPKDSDAEGIVAEDLEFEIRSFYFEQKA